MKDKKDIDHLFQEGFKNFEEQPGEHVWEAIAARQQEKRKRMLPFWIKWGSVAALLLLVLMAGNFWFTATKGSQPLVETNPKNLMPINQPSPDKKAPSFKEPDAQESESTVVSDAQRLNAQQKTLTGTKDAGLAGTRPAVPSSVNKNESGSFSQSKNGPVPQHNEKAALTLNRTPLSALDQESAEQAPEQLDFPGQETLSSGVTSNASSKSGSAVEPNPEELERIAQAKKEKEQTPAEDSAEKTTASEIKTRWTVTPVVAPVYYGDFGGSGIDPQFANNTKKGEVSLSYGVQVSYAVAKKLKLRTGFNQVDLGYRTEQVAFSPSIQANTLKSIDYREKATILEISTLNPAELSTSSIPELSSNSPSIPSVLHQQLTYIEVPLEAEYAVISNRFGMQVVAGFSTMFLKDNSITLEDNTNFTSELGSSNSLNPTSFSSNIGLGLDYQITPRMQVNLEPMFKYQLNAYTKSVSDFKPYYLGLYTGFAIQF